MRKLNKDEAMELVDGILGRKVYIMTYDKRSGISSNPKRVQKRKVKWYVGSADYIVYFASEYVKKIELHGIKGRFNVPSFDSLIILF